MSSIPATLATPKTNGDTSFKSVSSKCITALVVSILLICGVGLGFYYFTNTLAAVAISGGLLGVSVVAILTYFRNRNKGWTNLDKQKMQEIGGLCSKAGVSLNGTCILINIFTQRLHLIVFQQLKMSYLISTAKNGVGQKEGSFQTPLGLHVIGAKLGEGAGPFEIFKNRISTRKIAEIDTMDGDQKWSIISRILWLQGFEPGFNKGQDSEGTVVDSHDRYIYIHGTNDIANIGKPVSSGCIRMRPNDVIDLFGKVIESTPVYIYKS